MALSFALIAAAPVRAAEPNQLTPEQIAEGWVSLFDGKTLDGWQPTSDADWTVVDGEIRAGRGEQGFLMTEREYADYELHVEFKAPATTNSGIFLRTPLAPADPATDCYELNIAPPDNPFPTGSLVGRKRYPERGDPVAEWKTNQDQDPATDDTDPWNGQWHAFDVTLKGGMVTITLLDLIWHNYADEQTLPRSHIGLQFREGEIAFRSIRIKELSREEQRRIGRG